MSFKEIGRKIQQAREEKGLSQEQLARAIGCSQSALSNYEKGKRRLYLTQLEQLAEVLDKPIAYFLETPDRQEDEPAPDHKDGYILRLLNEIYGLTPDERCQVMDFITFLRWRRQMEGKRNGQSGAYPRTKKAGRKNTHPGSGEN